MLQIRTVLCPVDLTDLDARAIDLAVEVCRSFGARLILHHNLNHVPSGPAVSWMYHQEHQNGRAPEKKASDALRAMLNSLPPEIRGEARLSNGGTATAVLHVEEDTDADLVILSTRGASTPDHTSVTEQIIEQSVCPVLALHEGGKPALHIAPAETQILDVLVPTDFSPAGEQATLYACELARVLPIRLHLLHVIPGKSSWIETGTFLAGTQILEDTSVADARQKLAAAVPQELENRVTVHVEIGDTAEKIAEMAVRLGVSCVVMGAHARTLLRRFFTRDTSLALLHKMACPVWFVPETVAA
ncbi:MAG TPA: universal stress protein [Thermoanaerobaculia bacterium]|nr:universal stress protein [Thermoanaerobaculia bacterium]